MEASELRIGNLTDKGFVKSFYEHGIHVGNGKTFKFSECNGVIINELIAEKIGFMNFDGFYIHPHFTHCEFDLKKHRLTMQSHCEACGFENYNGYDIELKFVHTFQNLFFYLNAQELKFDLCQSSTTK